MSDLIRRLTAATNANARRVAKVTCRDSLSNRDRWQPTSCAVIYDGHRCHLSRPDHTSSHTCACGLVFNGGLRRG